MTKKNHDANAFESSGGDVGESKYLTITAISKRINQLLDGSKPLVKTDSIDLVEIAREEFSHGKFHLKFNKSVEYDEAADSYDIDEL